MRRRKANRPANGGPRSAAFWHRWLSLLIILPLLPIAVTGVFLNHVEGLGFDKGYVENGWLLDWYGIDLAAPEHGYPVDRRWFIAYQGALWLDEQRVGAVDSPLVGAARAGDFLAAASRKELWLLLADGEVADRLTAPRLPGVPQALATEDERLLLRTDDGLFMADAEVQAWTPYTGGWSGQIAAQTLPPDLATAVKRRAEQRSLTWEQVVLDLHSGRIVGTPGVLLTDLVALILVVLALTGIWLWLRHLRGQRARKAFLRDLSKR